MALARGTRAVARQNCSVGNTEVPLQVRGTAREEGNEPAADLEDAKQARGSRQGAQREQCRRRCAGTVGLLRIFKSCFFSVLGTSRSASLDQSLGYGLCDRLVIVIFMFAQSFRVGNFQATRGFVTE